MSGDELPALLQRCGAGEERAWEYFAAWVEARGRAVLGCFRQLNEADREDAVAAAIKSLVPVVQRGGILGTTNAAIDAYVCKAIRNRALNVLRGRARRREAGESALETPGADTGGNASYDEPADERPSQDGQAMMAEQLDRLERLLLSWPAEDRYLFIAKLHGVSAKIIQETLQQPPFELFTAITTVDTRFHRLRKRLMKHFVES